MVNCSRPFGWILLSLLAIFAGCQAKEESKPTPTNATAEQPATSPTLAAKELGIPDRLIDPNAKSVTSNGIVGSGQVIADIQVVPVQHTEIGFLQTASNTPEYAKPKIDPVQQNGPIFEGWPKPKVAIALTGDQMGYIEPCGCAGLENQKGGLSRRFTLLQQLRKDGWPVVSVDLGELINRFGKQAEIKFQAAVKGLTQMDYAAIGFGPSDLRLPAGILVTVATAGGDKPSPFVSANVGLFGLDTGFTRRYSVVEAGGRRIGITTVLGDDEQKQLSASEDITLLPAEKALAEVLPELKAKSDYRVLLCYADPKEAERIAAKFPDFDVVVAAHGTDTPPNQPTMLANGAMLIDVGHKGMYAIVLGLYDDEHRPVRYQRVPLDARFAPSPEMEALKTEYQQQLQTLGWEGLEIHPKSHPRSGSKGDLMGSFVGSQKCGECHTKAFEIWEKTPHSHATETLVKLTPPRQFDAECVSCHATGWNPQQYFPYETGYLNAEMSPHLFGNGCENCHGPGGAHTAAELGETPADAATLNKLRAMMRVPLGNSVKNSCTQCHDLDNSPEFHHEGAFEKYWSKVEHKGKD